MDLRKRLGIDERLFLGLHVIEVRQPADKRAQV